MSDSSPALVAPDASVYYGNGYWNEYALVRNEINRRISGDINEDYVAFFRTRIGTRRFARALFLNCGNGWVEREFYERGLFDSAVGIDFSEELLAEAREEGSAFPIRYKQMDVNEARFPDSSYDLIVNFSAGHHIAYVDRVYRELCRLATPDGFFINYDYVGAHRNQYPYEQWSAVWELNKTLPAQARQELKYPHLGTMIATDPTEAIHSELTLNTFARYFNMRDFAPTGGSLAYPILTFNKSLGPLEEPSLSNVLTAVMKADERFLRAFPHLTLFAYWFGTPRHDILYDKQLLARWEREENEREEVAIQNGGRYYPETLLQSLEYPHG